MRDALLKAVWLYSGEPRDKNNLKGEDYNGACSTLSFIYHLSNYGTFGTRNCSESALQVLCEVAQKAGECDKENQLYYDGHCYTVRVRALSSV